MLSPLLFFLLFETVQPSYATLVKMLPENVIMQASVLSAPSLNVNNAPFKKGDSIAPVIEAQSVYSIDLTSGMPLFVRDIFARRSIASITKLITAMIILDRHSVNEVLTVSRNAATQNGSKMDLREGEKITVKDALIGMLVDSGNDAAVALAEFDAGSEKSFLEEMNAKAADLGLTNSHFSNAKGFDEPDNYSTAFDTMIFGKAALSYPFIRSTVSIKTGEVTSADGKIKHKLESTNELLDNPYYTVVGLKTGNTPGAGQSFVSLMKAPNNHEILSVMLDSPSRFKETKILLDWILRTYTFP
ncbi:MAG: D-alanyl-D-alanine carboxypeptidase [Candidatus Peregrinibacteria bacterium GW2011_GWA2_47_7]|nr:MAG: D-alanyl-D-alanine carboxypeptidase [Candidatus Peregrinibacteria bacterium GW2011_GWA2_47_7]